MLFSLFSSEYHLMLLWRLSTEDTELRIRWWVTSLRRKILRSCRPCDVSLTPASLPVACVGSRSLCRDSSTDTWSVTVTPSGTSAHSVARVSTTPSIWRDTPELIQVGGLVRWSEWFVMLCFPGVRPYKCNLCEKSFTQRCSLESHCLKVHGVAHQYEYKQRRSKVNKNWN